VTQRTEQLALTPEQQAHTCARTRDLLLHDGAWVVAPHLLHDGIEFRLVVRHSVAVDGLEAELLPAVRLDDDRIALRRAVVLARYGDTKLQCALMYRLLIIERVERLFRRDEEVRQRGEFLPMGGDSVERHCADTEQHRMLIFFEHTQQLFSVVRVRAGPVDPAEGIAGLRH